MSFDVTLSAEYRDRIYSKTSVSMPPNLTARRATGMPIALGVYPNFTISDQAVNVFDEVVGVL